MDFEFRNNGIFKKAKHDEVSAPKKEITPTSSKTNSLQFTFGNKEIRVIMKDGEPLFCLVDICKTLEIQNGADVKNSVKSEFGDDLDLIYPIKDSLGREQKATFITEPQLYFVLMRSDKSQAKPFRQWVVKEVLPSIRKTGSYSAQAQVPKTYKEALIELLAEVEKREALEKQISAQKPLVDFASNIAVSANSISIGDFAKILSSNGVFKGGQNRLFEWMRSNLYLLANNMPYQKYINEGLFEIKEGVYIIPNGQGTKSYTQTLITGRGQIYFIAKIKEYTQRRD